MLQGLLLAWSRLIECPFVLAFLAGWSGLQPADDGIRYYSLKDPNPEPGLAWFVLNAFFLVGVVVLVTLALGVAFGSFRYWLLEKFPHNRFNGAPEDDPAITLRLTNDEPSPPHDLAPDEIQR